MYRGGISVILHKSRFWWYISRLAGIDGTVWVTVRPTRPWVTTEDSTMGTDTGVWMLAKAQRQQGYTSCYRCHPRSHNWFGTGDARCKRGDGRQHLR